MRNRQLGITFIGWLFLLVPIALVGYAGIRITPIYLTYIKVARSMDQTADALKADSNLSLQVVTRALEKRFDIEGIEYPDIKDIVIKRVDGVWQMQAAYEDVAPLFFDISLLVSLDKTVQIGSGVAAE